MIKATPLSGVGCVGVGGAMMDVLKIFFFCFHFHSHAPVQEVAAAWAAAASADLFAVSDQMSGLNN